MPGCAWLTIPVNRGGARNDPSVQARAVPLENGILWSWGESNPRPRWLPCLVIRPCQVRCFFVPQVVSAATTGLASFTALVFPSRHSSFRASADYSCRQPSLLLPGCDGMAPCGLTAHDVAVSALPLGGDESGLGQDGLSLGDGIEVHVYLGAPFQESEQLRSHAASRTSSRNRSAPCGVTAYVIGCSLSRS